MFTSLFVLFTMPKTLFAWIGKTDLQASRGVASAGLGPIAQAVEARNFDRVTLISDWPDDEAMSYSAWLRERHASPVELFRRPLPNGPTDFGGIYQAAKGVVEQVLETDTSNEPVFHLSPGSPAMAAVWILLAKTRYAAELIESSLQQGVRTAVVPFDIAAEFIPDLLRERDGILELASTGRAPDAPGFGDIIYRSPAMTRVVRMARRVAARSITVLIEGESGTGKELIARAIHHAGPRCEGPFIAVNCGAIAPELAESELFGHRKGAFTGAMDHRRGHFESAHGGTILLDEIGELPLATQVKLLRVLQEREVVPVGESKARAVDVRVIAATNRSLLREVTKGRFREDLFYRLAVAVLTLPPLRERVGDVGLLVNHVLEQINKDSALEPGFTTKSLSAAARNVLLQHEWPGNVRELQNTLRRAAIWSDAPTITPEDVRDALLPAPLRPTDSGVLDLPLGNGFDIEAILGRVARHYLARAMRDANGNKSQAAALVGLASYQTFTNWLKRYQIEASA